MIKKIERRISLFQKFYNYKQVSNSYWSSYQNTTSNHSKHKVVLEISELNPLELEIIQNAFAACQTTNKADVLISNFKLNKIHKIPLIFSIHNSKINWSFLFNISNLLMKPVILFNSIQLYNRVKSLKDLENLKFKGILIGDLIYDSYIRLYNHSHTPKKDVILFQLITKSLNLVYKYFRYFRSNKVEISIAGDKCYLFHGIFLRVALTNNSKCFYFTGRTLKPYNDPLEKVHKHHPEMDIKTLEDNYKNYDVETEISLYFKKRFNGNIDEIDVISAFKDKKSVSKADLIKNLELDPNKKNATIFPHATKDFPHVTKCIYQDYYQWLLNILVIVKNNSKVNWLIKPHPTSYLFGEVGLVEKLMFQLEVNNVVVIPKEISTSSVIELTDICLTVCGTCGLEMGCFGKPTVNAGNSLYSGYGFNYEAPNRETYIEMINNIDTLQPLNKDQIRAAKLVAFHIFVMDQNYPNYLFKNYSSEKDLESLFENAIANYKSNKPSILAKEWKMVIESN